MRCSREWLVDESSHISGVYLNIEDPMCSVFGALCHVYRGCPPLFVESFSFIARGAGFAAKEVRLRLSRGVWRHHCSSTNRSHVHQVLEYRYPSRLVACCRKGRVGRSHREVDPRSRPEL